MKNIEFSPSVFDDRKAELPQQASFSWTPWVIASVLVLALIGFAAYFISMKFGAISQSVALSPDIHPPLERGFIPATSVSMARPVEPDFHNGNCAGDEIICTVATASNPVELLHKLVSAVPISGAKQYRVRLSVTAIDEPASDNTTDLGTP